MLKRGQYFTMVLVDKIRNLLNNTDKRSALIKKNIFLSFVIKGWSALIIFLLVPITLNCLGEYKNGVWLTISSLLIWIDNLDIGLGNGLRNKLAEYMAKNNYGKAREAVSSTFFMLICIIMPTMLLLIAIISFIDINTFLGVDKNIVNNLNLIMVLAISMVSTTFIFKFIGQIYMGLQMPAINNFLITSGQTLMLIMTYILYLTDTATLLSIVIVNTGSPLIVYLLSYPYTFYYKYPQLRPSIKHIEKKMILSLFLIGVKFFILQISTVLIFMSSNAILSRYFSPVVVTPYQAAYRYFNIALILFNILSIPYWSATTDAWTRRDIAWINNAIHQMIKNTTVLLLFIIFMIIISPLFYHIWLKNLTIIPLSMTVSIAIYISIVIISMTFSNFLNGIGAFNLQLITTVSGAILYIPLTIIAITNIHNPIFVILMMALVYAPGIFINYIQLNKIINGTATGIWQK